MHPVLKELKLETLAAYYNYTSNTECPVTYHRWSFLSMVGALIGRRSYLPMGHHNIYPNQYVMLVGDPGTRKSTAINIVDKLSRRLGYSNIATGRTRRDVFIQNLSEGFTSLNATAQQKADDFDLSFLNSDTLKDINLDTSENEAYIIASEFVNFLGTNNENFIYLLTDLWDCPDTHQDQLSTRAVPTLTNPTINILGGTTTQGIMDIFPPSSLNQGILTRTILIHGDAGVNKFAFPEAPDETLIHGIQKELQTNLNKVQGKLQFTKEAIRYLDTVYNTTEAFKDSRLTYYSNRRFTHLLKLVIILGTVSGQKIVPKDLVVYANTLLAIAEADMPKALGQYGLSKNAIAATEVMESIANATLPQTMMDIWQSTFTYFTKSSDLIELLNNLGNANKIKLIPFKCPTTGLDKQGYIPNLESTTDLEKNTLIDLSLAEEYL